MKQHTTHPQRNNPDVGIATLAFESEANNLDPFSPFASLKSLGTRPLFQEI
jgi:hypothetical protein